MNVSHTVSSTLVTLAAFCMVVAPSVAAETSLHRPTVLDAVISGDSGLQGQLMDQAGQPLSRQPLTLIAATGAPQVTRTAADGAFAFSPVTPGLYRLQGVHGEAQVRLWSRDMAPPAARPALLLVSSQHVNRGQQTTNPYLGPLMVGGSVLTAAIVIPLVVDDAD